jgi:hypothetical protein
LFALASRADLAGALRRLFDGEPVNATEGRAALHTALRGDLSSAPAARAAHGDALGRAYDRMRAMVAGSNQVGSTHVVSIGIGGSDLGPRLVVDALAAAIADRACTSCPMSTAMQRSACLPDSIPRAPPRSWSPRASAPRKPCSTARSCATGSAATSGCTRSAPT